MFKMPCATVPIMEAVSRMDQVAWWMTIIHDIRNHVIRPAITPS